MTSERLIARYERIADAPDAVARLRQFILDLAVRGRLVPQNANDEPASELLKGIAKEKARLGITQVVSPLEADEIPFKLPAGWGWSRIGEVCSKTGSGSTPRGGKEVYKETGVPFLRSQNVYDEGLRLNDVAYIDPATHERMGGTRVLPGDLLLNITGGSLGRCCRVPDEFGDANVSQHVAIIRVAVQGMEDFLHRLILSQYFQAFVFDEQTGAGRGGLPKNRMDRIAVALPPLAEQHRIVAKVDELMGLCDRIEAARAKREATRDRLAAASLARLNAPDPITFKDDARFVLDVLPAITTRPDQIKQLRQTILNLAVRGKLVPQDPKDEPATELLKRIATEKSRRVKEGKLRVQKALPTITEEEKEFELCNGWQWARVGDVIKLWNGFVFKSGDFQTKGIPVIRIGDLQGGEVVLSEANYVSDVVAKSVATEIWIPPDALLIAMSGATTGKTAFNHTGRPLLLNQRVGRIEVFLASVHFIRFFFETIIARNLSISFGTAIPNLSVQQINETVLALPPLAEQQRIVAKVDELMGLCDRLEASLITGEETGHLLLDALLAEALVPPERELAAAE